MHAIPAAKTAVTPSVLIVDADADTRSLYRELLQMNGYATLEAEDGRDALVSALAGSPRLVITELRLAYLDGLSLYAELRRIAPELANRCVLMTGGATSARAHALLEAYPGPRLTKPFGMRALREVLNLVAAGPATPGAGPR